MFKKSLLIAILTALLLCGCSSGGEAPVNGSLAESETVYTAEAIFDMLEESGVCDALDARTVLGEEAFDRNCEKLYGAEVSQLSDGGIMYVSSGVSADEISLLKANGDADTEELLKRRADMRYSDFEGYAPDELEKIKSAEVFEYGGFDILIISDSKDEIKAKIKEMK